MLAPFPSFLWPFFNFALQLSLSMQAEHLKFVQQRSFLWAIYLPTQWSIFLQPCIIHQFARLFWFLQKEVALLRSEIAWNWDPWCFGIVIRVRNSECQSWYRIPNFRNSVLTGFNFFLLKVLMFLDYFWQIDNFLISFCIVGDS